MPHLKSLLVSLPHPPLEQAPLFYRRAPRTNNIPRLLPSPYTQSRHLARDILTHLDIASNITTSPTLDSYLKRFSDNNFFKSRQTEKYPPKVLSAVGLINLKIESHSLRGTPWPDLLPANQSSVFEHWC